MFSVRNKLILVDLPGYGPASREEWGEMVSAYIQHHHRSLRRILLLTALGKWHPTDEAALAMLEELGVPVQVVICYIISVI